MADNSQTAGDDYVRALAKYIRQHERALADLLAPRQAAQPNWLTLGLTSSASRPSPVLLRLDPHHLFYLYLRFGEAGITQEQVGPVDVDMDGLPARPMSYVSLRHAIPEKDDDAMSFRTTFSAVTSIGSGWWATSATLPLPADVRYLYSCFTKLPALHLSPTAPSPSKGFIADFENLPDGKLVPLYAFKNLQLLVLRDLDPRAFIGWDALSLGLKRLEVYGSGLEDVGELLVDRVVDDAKRRLGQRSDGERRDPSSLPRAAWSQLRHLSLASNDLTFLPPEPFTAHFAHLVHLDLSGNLLVAIPTGLSSLASLRSLNCSNNMIDTLQGVYRHLGAVSHLDLSKNRLDGLAGLDRLFALERVDLSENRLVDASELERLASLPHLVDVLVAGNPFTRSPNWRIPTFASFAKAGRDPLRVRLEGAAPSYGERGRIGEVAKPIERERRTASESMPAQVVRSPERRTAPVSPIKPSVRVIDNHECGPISSSQASPSLDLGPTLTQPTPLVKKKKRKPRRIVDIDGGGQTQSLTAASSEEDRPATRRLGGHPRQASAMSVLSSETAVTEDEEEAAAFRRRIEALRQEVGTSWLTTLNAQQSRSGA